MSRPEVDQLNAEDYVNNILDRWRGTRKETIAWSKLQKMGLAAGWTDDETQLVRKSLAFTVEVLGDKPLRLDGSTKVQHALETALIYTEGVRPDPIAASYAILHDTVEDSDEEVQLDDIEKLFGKTHRQVIDGLSQVAGGNDPDRAMATIHKLYDLLTVDPRGLAVKIADRIHFWRHISDFPPNKLPNKAEDTMFYVPAATALGLYDQARELFRSALPYTEGGETAAARMFPKTVPDKLTDYCAAFIDVLRENTYQNWDIRMPEAYDAYLATFGNVAAIPDAVVPAFFTIVVRSGEQDGAEVYPGEWDANAMSILASLVRSFHITEHDYHQALAELNNGSLIVRIDLKTTAGTVRLQLVNQHRDFARKVTVFDTEDKDKVRAAVARAKTADMNLVFTLLKANPDLVETVYDFRQYLEQGMTVVYDSKGNPVPMIVGGTVLDAIMAIDQWGLSYRASGAYISPGEGATARLVGLGHIVSGGEWITAHLENRGTMTPEWFRLLKAPNTRRRLRERIDIVIRDEIRKNEAIEGSRAVVTQNRGVAVIENLMQTIAGERGLTMPKRWIGFDDPEIFRMIRDIPVTPFFRSLAEEVSDLTADFLIAVGTDAIVPDPGRTSILWHVAEKIVDMQAEHVSFGFIMPNEPRELAPILEMLGGCDINVVAMEIGDTYDSPGSTRKQLVFLTVNPRDAEKLRELVETDESLTVVKERLYCE